MSPTRWFCDTPNCRCGNVPAPFALPIPGSWESAEAWDDSCHTYQQPMTLNDARSYSASHAEASSSRITKAEQSSSTVNVGGRSISEPNWWHSYFAQHASRSSSEDRAKASSEGESWAAAAGFLSRSSSSSTVVKTDTNPASASATCKDLHIHTISFDRHGGTCSAMIRLHITTEPQEIVTFLVSAALLEEHSTTWAKRRNLGIPMGLDNRVQFAKHDNQDFMVGFGFSCPDHEAVNAFSWIMHILHGRPSSELPARVSSPALVNFADLSDYLGLTSMTDFRGEMWANQLTRGPVDLNTAVYTMCAAARYAEYELWDRAVGEVLRWCELDEKNQLRDREKELLRIPSAMIIKTVKGPLRNMKKKIAARGLNHGVEMPTEWESHS